MVNSLLAGVVREMVMVSLWRQRVLLPILLVIFSCQILRIIIFKNLQAAEGKFITKWGSKGDAKGQLNSPAGIDVDSFGNLYVADDGNSRIQKFTNNGDFVTMWGSEGSKNGQLDRPHDIDIDSSGNNDVYVAEQGNFQIQKFTSDGKFIKKWGTEGSDDNQFQDPHSVVVY